MDEDEAAALLEAVFDHYDLPYPQGYGERRIHCPVHEDRVSSASLHTGKGLWHCLACGAGGTGIDLIMEKEGMDYGKAHDLATSILGGSDAGVRRSNGRSDLGLSRRARHKSSGRKFVPPWGSL